MTMSPADMKGLFDTLKRGASTWLLSDPPPGAPSRNVAALSVASPQIIRWSVGCVAIVGLTRDSLVKLRDAATRALGGRPDPRDEIAAALRIADGLTLDTQTIGEAVTDLVRLVREARDSRDEAMARRVDAEAEKQDVEVALRGCTERAERAEAERDAALRRAEEAEDRLHCDVSAAEMKVEDLETQLSSMVSARDLTIRDLRTQESHAAGCVQGRAERAEALLRKIKQEADASEDARDFILWVIEGCGGELAAIIGARAST